MKVKNMTSPRSGKPVANQYIIHDHENRRVIFQSYDSIICSVHHGQRRIELDEKYFNYSRTTNKYFHEFMHNSELYQKAIKRHKEGVLKPFEIDHDGGRYTVSFVDLNFTPNPY